MQGCWNLKSEADVINVSRIEAARLGVALWRNNKGAMKDTTGRWVRYGLGHISAELDKRWKSSDYIAIGPRGKFWAIEFKHPDWIFTFKDVPQLNFIMQVNRLGGVGLFVTHPQQLINKINEELACS